MPYDRFIKATCRQLKINPSLVEVGFKLVGDAKMRSLNKQYRHKDKTTDVLSFPLLTKKELSTLIKKRAILNIGDIFINKKFTQKRPWLIVHGLLHLLGYDHELSQAQAKKMFALEDKILQSLGYETGHSLRY